MKHANIAFFVPHAGCPHQCSFCNQRGIAGKAAIPDAAEIRETCARAARELGSRAKNAQVAFFGGSFTAIARADIERLLEAAYPFVADQTFSGIRVSTRPDAITPKILELLQHYGVNAIELGAQSMSGQVLLSNRRGHTPQDVVEAAYLIREYGFSLGLQMMTGLYGSADQDDLDTAHALANLQPDTMRIYPTLVLEGTPLANLWRSGQYTPQTLEKAALLCAKLLAIFEERSIEVIRVGLHAQDTLEHTLLAGPYYPAFRELCESELLAGRIKAQLSGKAPGRYFVTVSPKSVSLLTGHGGKNLAHFRNLGYDMTIKQNAGFSRFMVELEEMTVASARP